MQPLALLDSSQVNAASAGVASALENVTDYQVNIEGVNDHEDDMDIVHHLTEIMENEQNNINNNTIFKTVVIQNQLTHDEYMVSWMFHSERQADRNVQFAEQHMEQHVHTLHSMAQND